MSNESRFDLVDENNRPTQAGVRRLEESLKNALFGADLKNIQRVIDEIKTLFANGDVEGLVRRLEQTTMHNAGADLSGEETHALNIAARVAITCLCPRLDNGSLALRDLSRMTQPTGSNSDKQIRFSQEVIRRELGLHVQM